MKKNNRSAVCFAALVLACVCLVGGFSAFATGGDAGDPLVTLSYLTKVFTPELMKKVDEKVAVNEQALIGKINQAIDDYSNEMKEALSSGGNESASYGVLAMTAGQNINIVAGSEVLLRSGKVNVTAGSDPALLNATDGSTLNLSGTLSMNHLYVAPLEGVVLTAAVDSVVLIRGQYILI